MLPPLGIICGIVVVFSFLIAWAKHTATYTAAEIQQHRAEWLGTATLKALQAKGFQQDPKAAKRAAAMLLEESIAKRAFLSPAYMSGLLKDKSDKSARQHARLATQALLSTYAEMSHANLSRVFAAAFISRPGETLAGGVALAVYAHRRSLELASTDSINSRYVADMAGAQQLVVAGCLRAIGREEIVNALLKSSKGSAALRNAIRGECRVILALPDVQARVIVKSQP